MFFHRKSLQPGRLQCPAQDDLFISIDKVPEFKRWMDGAVS
ncbi:MAG TPA: hypothetical protein VHO70_05155 [Chitinispirillaceae bacterium]|nr:hypothetical protein [Chitinispirillaceae bacterium]